MIRLPNIRCERSICSHWYGPDPPDAPGRVDANGIAGCCSLTSVEIDETGGCVSFERYRDPDDWSER